MRSSRMNPIVTDWVTASLDQPDVEIDQLDLAKITLPDDSRLEPGGYGEKSEVAHRIAAAESFVFVTPEYNHSYPASLKRLIDWHYGEWMFKPATIVAYGVHGGHAAIEHLRGVLAELNMVTTRRVLGLGAPWTAMDETGRYRPDDSVATGLAGALAELRWWARLLTDARANQPFTG
ncbi:NAD(P)H-dependent oxidoreductase [Actinophytocola sediminis]